MSENKVVECQNYSLIKYVIKMADLANNMTDSRQPFIFTVAHLMIGHALTGLVTSAVLLKTSPWPRVAVPATLVTAVGLGWLTVSTVGSLTSLGLMTSVCLMNPAGSLISHVGDFGNGSDGVELIGEVTVEYDYGA